MSAAARLRAIAATLGQPAAAMLWATVALAYVALTMTLLLLLTAWTRGGRLPDSIELRALPLSYGKWTLLYGGSPVVALGFPLARVSFFWEPRPGFWELSATLIYLSLGYAIRMLLIAALAALAVVIVVQLRRGAQHGSLGVSGGLAGAGLAGATVGVAAPVTALLGG